MTVLQKPLALVGFGLTPNVIVEPSAKVVMVSRFLGLVGSLSPQEQKFWVPNQLVHDPDSWTSPYLLHLKREYEVLINNHGYKVQEVYTV